ncbi:unnamed protein product [Hymenolepis diminuta]|uniref:Uncharacterized protein n=1 Tax=Hymenolepis diminuta TaxID=6216 RepID=A0A564ZEC8_HYMDI|nr:unnamed protein product [Hymenolepis diminuta]VUZ57807.1 unnamed protein product [Hymenolepis diminuta]VUZ57810.1 unnamed protein product [Hymenolepis diminuta]
MCLAKSVSLANGTMSKVFGQNVIEAALSYHRELMCSQTRAWWPHIDLSLAGPIRETSHPVELHSCSKWFKVMAIKPVTTGTVINSLLQVFANPGAPGNHVMSRSHQRVFLITAQWIDKGDALDDGRGELD